jgi:hypothetical protein
MTIYEKAKAISLLQSVEEVLMSFNDTLERALKNRKERIVKMKVAGPVVNGEPDVIHDDDAIMENAMDIKHEQEKRDMNNKNPDEFEPDVSKTDNISEEDGPQEPDPGER